MPHARPHLLLLAALLLAVGRPAAAQQLDSLSTGTRLRVNHQCPPGRGMIVRDGRLLQTIPAAEPQSGDTLRLAGGNGRSWAIPAEQVYGVERHLGGHSRAFTTVRGAGIGLLAGAALGGLLGFSTYREEPGDFIFGRGAATFLSALVGGVVGTPIGTLIGATQGGREWTPVFPARCR